MWADAVEEIKLRIKPPEELAEGKRQLNASMYYTMVVCLDMLNRLPERNHWLELWEKEHPDDPRVSQQKDFIISKRGHFKLQGQVLRESIEVWAKPSLENLEYHAHNVFR